MIVMGWLSPALEPDYAPLSSANARRGEADICERLSVLVADARLWRKGVEDQTQDVVKRACSRVLLEEERKGVWERGTPLTPPH